jgi:HK97 family phage major capsid protein
MELTPRRKNWLSASVEAAQRGKELHFWTDLRAGLKREAKTLLDDVEQSERELTDGETRRYEVLKDDLEFVDAKMHAQWQKQDAEIVAAGGTVSPRDEWGKQLGVSHLGGGTAPAGNLHEAEGAFRKHLYTLQRQPGLNGRRYHEVFSRVPQGDPMGGFKSAGEFLDVVASGLADSRLLQLNAATHMEGVPSQGGFVVPSSISASWLDASLDGEVVRSRCRVEPMTTSSLKVAGFDVSDMSTGAPFGFKAEWADENSDAAAQVGKFRAIELNAKKLRIYSEASSELVSDGISFEQQLGEALVKGIGWGLDEALLNSGTGAGSPLSVLNDPSLVVVSKETGQAASTITYTNCLSMYSRLMPAAMRGATWVVNSTALPQLMTMSVAIGVGGAFTPAVREANGKFSLLGLEIVFTEKLPTLGQKGDIILANFDYYTLGLRKEVVLEKSNAPGWSRDVMSYRVILRADAMGRLNQAYKPRNGSTQSWCVTLAARA